MRKLADLAEKEVHTFSSVDTWNNGKLPVHLFGLLGWRLIKS